MPELLLEIGCEELPASFVEKAYNDLAARLTEALTEAYGEPFTATALGTPRRLIVSIPNIATIQPDTTKEIRGPGIKAAYDAAGNPTGALQGFCRSQGLELSDLRKDDQYVWATKLIPGLPTPDLLASLIPAAIRKLTFEKSMRWGPHGTKFRFARPIRWILAAYDNAVVPLEFEGVPSGLESQGHRFYAPEKFPATHLEALLDGLRHRQVEPEPSVRRELLLQSIQEVAPNADIVEDLIDENVFLTEWPVAILGYFHTQYLELPEAVLTTAMAKHERMFPVRSANGQLVNQFVFIRNSGEDATVRRGSEWVLNARLADADFFFREDQKHLQEGGLDYFLEKTEGIVFQAQLGTVRQRADRLSKLAKRIAEDVGVDPAKAAKAGLYAKADLSSGLVNEFSSLQGIVGADYAQRLGFDPEVCDAIRGQYESAHPDENDVDLRTVLIFADALDKLAGYLGIGMTPSGSADPYALRRAATSLIQSGVPGNYFGYIHLASAGYSGQEMLNSAQITQGLRDIFLSRYEALYSADRPDFVQAAIYGGVETAPVLNPGAVSKRLVWISDLGQVTSLVQTLLRPLNIFKSFGEFPQIADYEPNLASSSGSKLYQALQQPYSDPAQRLKDLAPLIHEFFESTMVMDNDPKTKLARQLLVSDCRDAILEVGDFTKIVIEGV